MLEQLIQFLWLGLLATSLDVDNALYMTSVTQTRPASEQRRLILWGLVGEYAARMALVLVAFYLASGKEVFFQIGGFAVTPQVVALLGAGIFLFVNSVSDLDSYFSGEGDDKEQKATGTLTQVLLQMTIVNAVLSIDTVIAVASETTSLIGAAIILAVSGVIRFFFVDKIAGFIAVHPETKIVVLSFLSLIGLQLILQAFQDDLPEALFNGILVVAIIVALCTKSHASRKTKDQGAPAQETSLRPSN